MIRVFCFARSVQASDEWFVTYAESDSFFISSVVKPRVAQSVIDSLWAVRPGDRIPWAASVSSSVPPSCRMGTGFFFCGTKRPGRVVDYPPPI
jgi:hypothetical protein